jgi:hypothetical protein
MAEGGVCCELVSTISLFNRENTGKFCDIGVYNGKKRLKNPANPQISG